MLLVLVIALTSGLALGQSGFNMDESCSLTPASWRGLFYNHSKPFVVTAVTDPDNYCYYGGMTFEVIVAVNDIRTESYTDFMLQANPDTTYGMRPVGRSSSHPEFPDVSTGDCGNSDMNVIMSSKSGVYYAHTVYWTAPTDMDGDIIFNATFINSARGTYWTQTSRYPMKYNFLCDIPDVPHPSEATIPQTSLVMVLLAAILNVYMIM